MSEEKEYRTINKIERRTTSKFEIEVEYKGEAIRFEELFSPENKNIINYKINNINNTTGDIKYQIQKLKYKRKSDHLALREFLKKSLEDIGLTYVAPHQHYNDPKLFSIVGSYDDKVSFDVYLYDPNHGPHHFVEYEPNRGVFIFTRSYAISKSRGYPQARSYVRYRYEVALADEEAGKLIGQYYQNNINGGPPMGTKID